ncbi:probable F-box protein At2g36090 [Juglans microcarpa x Juglans regia]|uniref:probable F-box protein At2g36090 n=1 Tax=Juglans microcarpa x Juglans regia TaxID=2249226 RepID=UPI001B7E9421|nr:probable F-box protein At2g36090 [Juglans microcarpa x Juglans regia]
MAPSSTTTLTPPILSSTTATVDEGGATTISSIHPDIIQTHLLTRLDGPTLASAACTSSQLYTLCTQDILWTSICHSTWPSTNTPRLLHLISTFPNGSRSFFSDSFPLLTNSDPTPTADSPLNPDTSPPELISAVDLYYKGKLVFCKVIETETVSSWFRCSPFRLDLLDPKDVVSTPIRFPDCEDACLELEKDLALSWIMIEPIGRRAVNLSSHRAVSVQRHWLSGEIQVRFATIMTGERGSSSEFVQCGTVIMCGGSEGGELQLREVSLHLENMDGKHLNGKDSLAILGRVLESKKIRGKRRREEEEGGRKRYQDYLERTRERKARKLRTEGTLDTLCMAFGVLVFSSFWMFVLCR